jgi:hypothetical protein
MREVAEADAWVASEVRIGAVAEAVPQRGQMAELPH